MRCPSCNKFPAFDTSAEPEVSFDDCEVEPGELAEGESEPTNGVATVTGTVRIVLTSECCGDELKEANFDIDMQIDIEKAEECTCENWLENVEVEDGGPEITDRSETTKTVTYKRGSKKGQTEQKSIPYRYQKRFYGASVPVIVNCACGKEIGTGTFVDDVQASGMDELV